MDAVRDLGERLERHLGGPISGLSDISAGWESDVYAFRHAGADLVVRMYVGAGGVDKGEREFTGMRLLSAAGYPVPRVDAFEPYALGRPALIMENVPGELAWGDRTNAAMIADLLADLHGLDVAPFAAAFGDPADSAARRELHRWRRVLAPTGLTAFNPVLEWAETALDGVARLPPSVVHWDFHPDNVLVAPDRVAVVDWTQVDVSDRRFDVAWTWLLAHSYGREEWAGAFVAAYRRRCPVPDLEWFEAAACAKRLASIVVSLSAGPEALGMRPEAAGVMAAQLEPARRVYRLLVERTGLAVAEAERLLHL